MITFVCQLRNLTATSNSVGPAISSSAGVERDSPVASTSTAEEVDSDDDDVEDTAADVTC